MPRKNLEKGEGVGVETRGGGGGGGGGRGGGGGGGGGGGASLLERGANLEKGGFDIEMGRGLPPFYYFTVPLHLLCVGEKIKFL